VGRGASDEEDHVTNDVEGDAGRGGTADGGVPGAAPDRGAANDALYPDSDLYRYADLLTEAERAEILRLRSALETHLPPELLAEGWVRGECPVDALEPLAQGDFMEPAALRESGASWLFQGFRSFELTRHDASVATWFNGQASLFRSNVEVGGSPEQVAEWGPRVVDFSLRGVFALTEPDHGSDIAGGLATVARREGETWVIDGAKRWIGSAAYADRICVIARDVTGIDRVTGSDDGDASAGETAAGGRVAGRDGAGVRSAGRPAGRPVVRAFLVPRTAEGVTVEKIPHKAALRMVDNGHITLESVVVSEADRLHGVDTFADVAAMLRQMRATVAWQAAGLQAGAFEAARRYVLSRQQFGRPLGGFQLVQEKLSRMLGNVASTLGLCVRLAQRQDAGVFEEAESALAKREACRHMRETVALAREVCGGNGITLETDVARFHADAEALYTYEGTDDINALVVGRAITGLSAFAR
jgi:glutaryl-CoA dehydrogenase